MERLKIHRIDILDNLEMVGDPEGQNYENRNQEEEKKVIAHFNFEDRGNHNNHFVGSFVLPYGTNEEIYEMVLNKLRNIGGKV